MSGLQTGTVSLLFSDIEGSTALLGRLGPTYADTLHGHRKVLRAAWTAHSGTELGTSGDSFFVAFPTALDAVGAASLAQRELAAYRWPNGENVRVRIGIHTGSPPIHGGEYVGMDVHRAARIAAAAHGGQVVLSSAAAELAAASLPDGVGLRRLGPHRLKDLPQPEQLFQLQIDGLQTAFPPLKALGAAGSLPSPATQLVGRTGELAELATLLSSGARLVTLTGPGGSGKTRVAIALAHQAVAAFPDGVFFVPLAAATAAEQMWTTIAETLDVSPEHRTPPALLTHLANHSALLVLDNLEQLDGADTVVGDLLAQAPQVAVIATSRRPLHVPGEHEHTVPPLELPRGDALEEAARSGAVELFVQRVRQVRSSFTLTEANVSDVAAVCRRLDGLPLALELAAARSKLLSPRALLARLDSALDLAAPGHGPGRQRTLRATIDWSYDLLSDEQQGLFRRLGVFAGGADIDAITVVTCGDGDPASEDVVGIVGDLVDASLVTVTETPDGEPRIGMLETIRTYARAQLASNGEMEQTQQRHAQHFLAVAQRLNPMLDDARRLRARTQFELEHDNLREALTWALPPGAASASPTTAAPAANAQIGLRLYTAMRGFWNANGMFTDDQRWVARAIECGAGQDSPELAICLFTYAANLRYLGETERAYDTATASVDMWRRLDSPRTGLPTALNILGSVERQRGQRAEARKLYEESLGIARESGDKTQLRRVLGHLANLEFTEHNYQRVLDLHAEALAIAREVGNDIGALGTLQTMALARSRMGHAEEARQQLCDLIPQVLAYEEPASLMLLAEDCASVAAELGDHQLAVRLVGAAEASRERLGLWHDPLQLDALGDPLEKTRGIPAHEWDAADQEGRRTTVEAALTAFRSASSPAAGSVPITPA